MGRPKAIILGWINEGNQAQCGETVKNQHIISQLRQLGIEVITLDFYRWKRRPWVLAKTLGSLLFYPRTPLILSTAPKNVYALMKLHKWLHSPRRIIHWVIGGNVHKLLREGVFEAKYLQGLHVNIVETNEMLHSLISDGVTNTVQLPNFKPIEYKPRLAGAPSVAKFVFLSRIKPEKGVDYIFESVRMLNAKGLVDKYEVEFFGRIDEDYKARFFEAVDSLPNVKYSGFLDLNHKGGYDKLAEYSAMLFPTYWKSEGFAGIFIDAFVAGVPVIASDWAHNANIIVNGKTGFIIPPHDPAAMAQAMEKAISGQADITAMRHNCQAEAEKYDVENVVTPAFVQKIGLV